MADLTSNVDAERAVIADVLAWPANFDKVAGELIPADFLKHGHAEIWRVFGELVAAGEPINVPLVKARIPEAAADTFDEVVREYAPVGGATAHVREVKRCAVVRRQLAELGELAEDIKAGRGADRAQRLLQLEDDSRARERYLGGGAFIFTDRVTTRAVWGRESSVLWGGGEPLYIVGPPGVGKTTIAHQLVAGRMGLRDEVLGYPVAMHHSRVLYLASDRPNQIRFAFRRLFSRDDLEVLESDLVVWEGRPPVDFATNPEGLYAMARAVKADTVIVDSVKDVVSNINEPAQGQAFNTALQVCVANGVETLCLHHTRKKQQGVKQGIDDVYGGWLAAGAGSVVFLKGDPGANIVELHHVKQPMDEVGPLRILHDHDAGTSIVDRGEIDLVKVLAGAPMGARELAGMNYETSNPTRDQVEKMRKRCERKVAAGVLVRIGDDPNTVKYALKAR